MAMIAIEISSCKQCPHFKKTNSYSSDGWDHMQDWVCTRVHTVETGEPKAIQRAVEWHEEKYIEVPVWCPIKIED